MKSSFLWVTGLISFATSFSVADSENWPRWRGPYSNGNAAPGSYPVKWEPDQALWKTEIPGKGCSTPIVWEKKIYLTTGAKGKDTVLAINRSGKILWQKSLGKEVPGKHRNASGSNSSPVTDGNALFVFFKSGAFASLTFDGKVRWKTNLFEQFGKDNRFWDFGTSPVVTKKNVVMAEMHAGDSWLAAFDKKSGKLSWKVSRNYKTPREGDQAYTTPIVFSHKGTEALLVWGALHLTAHDASDGSMLWSCGGFNPKSKPLWAQVASPVITDGIALVCCGRADRRDPWFHGIKLGGKGDVTDTHRLWKRDDIGSFVPTPTVYKGRVYLVSDGGDVDCLDPETGKSFWHAELPRARSNVYASPLIAGEHLYVARKIGKVYVAKIEDKFELVSEIDMKEPVIASPVAIDGRLLIRGRKHLFCIGRQ